MQIPNFAVKFKNVGKSKFNTLKILKYLRKKRKQFNFFLRKFA